MEKLQKYCLKVFLILFILCIKTPLDAQVNCNYFLYLGDTARYNACVFIDSAKRYYQFTREFQEMYDQALKICPEYDYAWRAKSVAYVKSGDFITWKTLIDKAVQYDTLVNIGYRGWCKFQFFRDYSGAIEDIEWLEKNDTDIGYGANGDYHLTITKGLCYSQLGEKEKAIAIMENFVNSPGYIEGIYDHYQLAVTFLEVNNCEKALDYLNEQIRINNIAEAQYYKAKIYKQLGDEAAYKKCKTQAIDLYKNRRYMFDPYTVYVNHVYYQEIIDL